MESFHFIYGAKWLNNRKKNKNNKNKNKNKNNKNKRKPFSKAQQ